jgi:hypothetical protein
MRKFIIGLVLGVVLAGASTAAAYDSYWAKAGRTYSCQGEPSGLICKSKVTRGYQVLMDGKGVAVYNRSGHVQFTCRYGCIDLRY